jgi:SNF2 family DNA or RNA helicase
MESASISEHIMNIVQIECAVNGCGGCYMRPQFAADPDRHVLVSSLRTGGVGLNLTAASVVFHFDRWWNPAVETQAEDRAHRIGQTRPVQVFAYLTPDSIEQRIGEILDEKRALFADIIDGVATDGLRRLDLPTLLHAVGA